MSRIKLNEEILIKLGFEKITYINNKTDFKLKLPLKELPNKVINYLSLAINMNGDDYLIVWADLITTPLNYKIEFVDQVEIIYLAITGKKLEYDI